MEILSRSYHSGQSLRPKPYLIQRPDSNLIVIVTSWGSSAEAEKWGNQLREGCEANLDQSLELKSVFSEVSNRLYQEENSKAPQILLEAVVLKKQNRTLSWARVGHPNLYLVKGSAIAPLAVSSDFSGGSLEPEGKALPPLPREGLGLTEQTDIQSGQCRMEDSAQVLLLSHSWETPRFKMGQQPNFENLVQQMVEASESQPFWCAIVSF